jgi:hypothetical protein
VAQLAAVMTGDGSREERNRRFVTAFVRPQGLDVPATPGFVDAVEALARSGRCAPDPMLTQPSPMRAVVHRLALATRCGIGAWLLMDNIDAQRAVSERERGEHKQAVLDERAARWEAERRERDARLRRKQEQRGAKARLQVKKERKQQWRRWRYAFGTSRPVARLKGGLRLLFGGRHQ